MTKRTPWHSLPEYEAFRAVMQDGTTTAAARRLGLSQSAISRSLSSLENRTGRILFERQSGRLSPTQEAVRLNRRLDQLFEALDRIDGPTEPVRETLRLIAPPSYAQHFLVSQISGFLATNPHFFVSLEVNTSDEVIRGLLDDRFDLGLTGVEQTRAGVRLVPFRLAPAVCAMPRDHRLAGHKVVRASDLHGEAMVALTHRHVRRAQMDKLLNAARATPRIVAEVSTSFAAADLAREGMGVAVINPFPVVQARGGDLVFRLFDGPIEYCTYVAVSDNRPMPRIARAFIRHLRLHCPPDPFSRKA